LCAAVYRRILVAMDGSETAKLALQEGITLARESRAQLRLVHVIDVMPHGTAVVDPEALRQAIRREGEEVVEGPLSYLVRVASRPRQCCGKPIGDIAAAK
jgi:nucleotide-binding universal stress UspA family protein